MKLIVVVEDSKSMLACIHVILATNNFQTMLFENGKQAFEGLKLTKKNIDLILVDMNMPVMNGEKFIKEIRKEEKYKDTPIIIVTSETENVAILILLIKDYNVAGWIIKPFFPDILINTINMFIQ